MPSLNNTTDGFNSGHPRRNYITTSAFNNDFYLYTVTRSQTSNVLTGTLSAVVGATAANCPANRILRENGRRLYKDANPGISTLLVGVYDAVSGLSGLIDPNSARFAVYNGDKSVFQDNGVDPNGGLVDQGPPIYTRGSVTALGGFTGPVRNATSTALISITANGAATAQSLDLSLGNVFTFTVSPPSGVASITLTPSNLTTATTSSVGQTITLIITATTVQNTTITFGTGFVKTGTLVVTAGGGTQYYVVTFTSDGTRVYEQSRTAALT
jgi:hypothetical protein